VIAYLLGSCATSPVNEENRQLPEKAEEARIRREVKVHHGLITSGNKVVKDTKTLESGLEIYKQWRTDSLPLSKCFIISLYMIRMSWPRCAM
jgi:hypothetical protein